VLTSCTDADVVRLDSANTVLTIETSPQTLGFEQAGWGISSLLVQYADADAREANGNSLFTLLTNTVPIDLLGETKQVDGPSLRPEIYEVVSMQVSGPALVDNDPADIGDPTVECWEKVALFANCITGTGGTYTLDFGALPDLPRFQARSGAASEVKIIIDSDELILSYVRSFQCNDVPGGRCSNNTSPCARDAPCVSNFDAGEFESNGPSSIRFQ
jgi:hypothetical protein